MLTDPGDERRAHVRVGVGDLLRVAAVFGQVSGETSHRVRAAPLGGEQHPPEFHVGEDAHVVLAFAVNGSEAEVIVLRVGRKATSRGTIYQEGRPS
jgi:hypothetical protein